MRGIQDILVACIDNLNGFGDAIEDILCTTVPGTPDAQLHEIYEREKDRKPMVKDLKAVYTAINEQMAAQYLDQAEEKWSGKCKVVFKSWRSNWQRLTSFYAIHRHYGE